MFKGSRYERNEMVNEKLSNVRFRYFYLNPYFATVKVWRIEDTFLSSFMYMVNVYNWG